MVAKDAVLFGMCLLGDGATVRGMPLMNVIVTTPSANSVIDIIDCTDHMEVGGKKDAQYIAQIFDEHIKALDPTGVHLNAVLFDGASNVQKAGRVIEAKYPQVSVLHGVEHVVSLFFADVSKLRFVQFLIMNYRRVYRVFGSGAMHAPYAMFHRNTQTFNGGKRIGLIRAADTRMAGYFIAFHRMLRLRPALEATIASVEFRGLNLSKAVVVKVIAFLNNQEMWKSLHALTHCLFPALRVLRLANKSEPGFDSLYYFVRRADKAMEWSSSSFERITYFSSATRDPDVLQDLFRSERHEEEDDEFESMLAVGHDDDGEGNSDDESQLSVEEGNSGTDLMDNILRLWNKRRVNMMSDFSIAGWLLSPLEEVMQDVKNNRIAMDNWAMDRILDKFYYRETETERGRIKDAFWTEFSEFNNKTGRFGEGRTYIWNSELLRRRMSAKWHAQYSVAHTDVSVVVCCLLFLFFFI